MTREEAIEYNKNLRMYMKLSDKNQPCKFLEENYTALDMAIKSIEAWEKVITEIKSVFYKIPPYTQGYAAYQECMMIIHKYLEEVSE